MTARSHWSQSPRQGHAIRSWSDRILIIYRLPIVTNKQVPTVQFNRVCAWCCTQHLMYTGKYCQLFLLALTLIWQHAWSQETSSTGSFFQHTLGLIWGVAGQKGHLQFLRAIPLSLTTPVSWVDFLSPLVLVGTTSNNYCQVKWTALGCSPIPLERAFHLLKQSIGKIAQAKGSKYSNKHLVWCKHGWVKNS